MRAVLQESLFQLGPLLRCFARRERRKRLNREAPTTLGEAELKGQAQGNLSENSGSENGGLRCPPCSPTPQHLYRTRLAVPRVLRSRPEPDRQVDARPHRPAALNVTQRQRVGREVGPPAAVAAHAGRDLHVDVKGAPPPGGGLLRAQDDCVDGTDAHTARAGCVRMHVHDGGVAHLQHRGTRRKRERNHCMAQARRACHNHDQARRLTAASIILLSARRHVIRIESVHWRAEGRHDGARVRPAAARARLLGGLRQLHCGRLRPGVNRHIVQRPPARENRPTAEGQGRSPSRRKRRWSAPLVLHREQPGALVDSSATAHCADTQAGGAKHKGGRRHCRKSSPGGDAGDPLEVLPPPELGARGEGVRG